MSAPAPDLVFLDLDRTVMYSRRRLGRPGTGGLRCVEVFRGQPWSFLTTAAADALCRLQRQAVVVPCTTRTLAQLARVRLPGTPARYAVAANGGHLLVDGVPDPRWSATVQAALAGCAPAHRVTAHLDGADPGLVRDVRVADGLFVRVRLHPEDPPDGWLDELAGRCSGWGWRTSRQGRTVHLVPDPLTKSAAAREVARRCGGGRLLAAGDSDLDADLLAVADAAIRPAHGELADRGFALDHLAVTTARGALAGEEILCWLLERTGSEVPGRRG